jgi:uncharacterized protein
VTVEPFWRHKSLAEMSREEWESLCDGCAQCCRIKLEDVDSGDIGVTDVVCELLDRRACRCTDYANRHTRVSDCIEFGADVVLSLRWLPKTCGYRLVAEGRDLPDWHPLVSGDPESVHRARRSVRGQVQSERFVHPDELEARIVRWIDGSSERRS